MKFHYLNDKSYPNFENLEASSSLVESVYKDDILDIEALSGTESNSSGYARYRDLRSI
jgi:hypothetical protein